MSSHQQGGRTTGSDSVPTAHSTNKKFDSQVQQKYSTNE